MCVRAGVALHLLVFFPLAHALYFYVSPSGSDGNSGSSPLQAWATLPRAQQGVRSALQPQTENITVYLASGTYNIPQTLNFSSLDSGAAPFSVTWSAALDAPTPPVLSGGAEVTGFALYDKGRNVWKAPLPAGVLDARQVYLQASALDEYVRLTPGTSGGLGYGITLSPAGLTATGNFSFMFVAEQAGQDIELVYTGQGSSFTECRARALTAAPLYANGSGLNLTMAQPGYALVRGKPYGQGPSFPASVQNLYATFGAGGFYLNSLTQDLYISPPPGVDLSKASVVVPATEVLLRGTGAQNLLFNRLQFSFSTWLEINQGWGYASQQSGFRVLEANATDDRLWTPVPGAIRLQNCTSVAIVASNFSSLGSTAVQVDGGSQGCSIVNSTFRQIAGGGVLLGGVKDCNATAAQANSGFLVHGNLFDSIPNEFHDCAPLLGGFVSNTVLERNTVQYNSNTGISLGWGWSRDLCSNVYNNHIRANKVHGSNWLLSDGGSIYALGPQPSSTMEGNFILGQVKREAALYTDEGSAWWHIFNNVVQGAPFWLSVWTPTIHDELIESCWTDSGRYVNHGTNITLRNITIVSGNQWPAEALAIMQAAGVPW